MKGQGLSEPECPFPILKSCKKCPANSRNGGECEGWRVMEK